MNESTSNKELNELIGWLQLFRVGRDLPPVLVAAKVKDGSVKPEGIVI